MFFDYAHNYGRDHQDIFMLISHRTGAIFYVDKDAKKVDDMREQLIKEHPTLQSDLSGYHAYEDRLFEKNIEAVEKGALTHLDVMDYRRWGNFGHWYVFVVNARHYLTKENKYLGTFTDIRKAKAKANSLMSKYAPIDKIEIHRVELNGDEDEIIVTYRTDKYGRFVKVKGE